MSSADDMLGERAHEQAQEARSLLDAMAAAGVGARLSAWGVRALLAYCQALEERIRGLEEE